MTGRQMGESALGKPLKREETDLWPHKPKLLVHDILLSANRCKLIQWEQKQSRLLDREEVQEI